MMTLNEYQELAMRTATEIRNYRSMLQYSCIGLAGEVGELCNSIKKMFYHGHDYSNAELVEELGDILWYVSYTAWTLGMDLDEVAAINIAKLRRRYPDGFSSERSRNHED